MSQASQNPERQRMPPPRFVRPAGNAAVSKETMHPPEKKTVVVPTCAPQPPISSPHPGPSAAAKAAAVAAAQAAQHVTPAQRERVAMEAAAEALARHATAQAHAQANTDRNGDGATEAEEAQEREAPRPPGTYEPPSWGASGTKIPYTMEVLKAGTILATLDLQSLATTAHRGFLTFGRTPDNDVLLDHPSSSRLHAVLQFRGDDGGVFLYDPGSTHGTYLNKRRIPGRQHVQVRVGDQIRFGESTRLNILGGPAELLPEEGLNKEQRRQAAAMEALRKRQEEEAAAAQAQMALAIAQRDGGHGGGVTWGLDMADVDVDQDGFDPEDIEDWRAYAASKGLSEKQQKIADKIRRKENKVVAMEREIDRIRAKQRGMEELSGGQVATMARNEREMERIAVEIDDLEEELLEAIRRAVKQERQRQQSGGISGEASKSRLKRGASGSDEEAVVSADGSDEDEDSFYDRTGGAAWQGRKRQRRQGVGLKSGRKERERHVAEDAASLFGKIIALQELQGTLEVRLQEEREKEMAAAEAAKRAAERAALDPGKDSLDAFMEVNVAGRDSTASTALKREVAEIQHRIDATQRLLRIADPDGLFDKTDAVLELKSIQDAVQRARNTLNKERGSATTSTQTNAAPAPAPGHGAGAAYYEMAATQSKGEKFEQCKLSIQRRDGGCSGASSPPERALGTEKVRADSRDASKPTPGNESLHGALDAAPPAGKGSQTSPKVATQQIRHQAAPVLADQKPMAAVTTVHGSTPVVPHSSLHCLAPPDSHAHAQETMGGLQVRQKPVVRGPQLPPHLLHLKNKDHEPAVASVASDLEVLHRASQGAGGALGTWHGEREEGGTEGAWRPPEGQTGDGRSKLNDALGY